MRYRTVFTVQGMGEFPVDMLRYDRCTPHREVDSYSIRHGYGDSHPERTQRTVMIQIDHDVKVPDITPDRWQSFGWRVLTDTIDTWPRPR